MRYLEGARFVFGHSLVELLEALVDRHPAMAALRDAARQLDQYYIPTRYPNGLPGGVPADVFSRSQAEQAVSHARRFLEEAQRLLGTA